jgi:hypothetical protein
VIEKINISIKESRCPEKAQESGKEQVFIVNVVDSL